MWADDQIEANMVRLYRAGSVGDCQGTKMATCHPVFVDGRFPNQNRPRNWSGSAGSFSLWPFAPQQISRLRQFIDVKKAPPHKGDVSQAALD